MINSFVLLMLKDLIPMRLSLRKNWMAVALVLVSLLARAQAPAWQVPIGVLASGSGAASYAFENDMVPDGAGNFYVAGSFAGTISLGSLSLTAPTGQGRSFLAKWNAGSRQFLWAQQFNTGISKLAVRGNNLYVTGGFEGQTTFGSAVLTSVGDADIVVAKLTDTGTGVVVNWVQQAGGSGVDFAETIAVSGSSVYVGGRFANSAAFGSISASGPSAVTGYVTKLADNGSAGTFGWVQSLSATSQCDVYGLVATGSTIYLAGTFTGTLPLGNVTLSAPGSAALVAKLTDLGGSASIAWAVQTGSSNFSATAFNVAVSGSSVYVVGYFGGTTSFGSLSLTSAGYEDAFVAKLADTGTMASFVWAQRAGGAGNDAALTIAVGGPQVYVGGSFYGTADFGPTSLTSVGNDDGFVLRLADAGALPVVGWVQQVGGPSDDAVRNLALSGTTVLTSGLFKSTVQFGGQTLSSSNANVSTFINTLADQALATPSPALQASLALYPNPAHGTTTVRVPAGAGAATLTLLDALGRVAGTYAAPTGQDYPLSLAGLAPGVYALRVRVGEAAATQKLVVE